MPQSFSNQVERIALRQRGRTVATATCWAIAAGVGWFLLLLACDRLLTPESHGIRLLFSACGLVGAIFIVVCWWRHISQGRTSPLAIALQMEKHYPQLQNIAASALNFASQEPEDPRAGSVSLRRAIVLQANSLSEQLDWQALLPRRPLRLAIRGLAAVLLILLLLAWLSPQTLTVGWLRLSLPFVATHWPRENNLEFVNLPKQVLLGSTLELTLRDAAGPLPEDAKVHFRQWRNGRWNENDLPLVKDESSATAHVVNVREELEVRATGGDHQTMPWREISVVEPPRIQSLKASVQPPRYSGIEPFEWRPGLQLLEGSRLQIAVTCDQPIHAVELVQQGGTQYSGKQVSSGDTFNFQIEELALADAGTYHLELTNPDMLTARSQKEITLEVRADLPPLVQFVLPYELELLATPTASIELAMNARDDLALHEVGFELLDSNTADALKTLALWKASDSDPNSSVSSTGTLELSEFSLQPGTELSVVGWARDFRPQIGTTTGPMKLRIVSEEELLKWISEIQNRIQTQLWKSLRLQSDLQAAATDLRESVSAYDEQTRSQLQAILFGQRRIAASLHGEPESVNQFAKKLLRAIHRNHLPLGDTQRTLRTVRDAVSQLAEESLPSVEASLTTAARRWELGQQADVAGIKKDLASGIEFQSQVITVLEQLLEGVSRDTDLARVAEELNSIGKRQKELADDSQRIMRDWLSQPKQPPTTRSRESAGKQKQLARRMASLSQRMEGLAEELAERYPQLSGKLKQACAACQKAGVTNKMYSAAEQLAKGRLSNSNQLQRQAADDIRKLSEALIRQSDPSKESQSTAQDGGSGKKTRSFNKPGARPSETTESISDQLVDIDSREQVAALVDELWGHLPERQREQILQPLGADFLPEYSEDIKEYFRALASPAEEGQQSP